MCEASLQDFSHSAQSRDKQHLHKLLISRVHHCKLAIINFEFSKLTFTVFNIRNFNYLELQIPGSVPVHHSRKCEDLLGWFKHLKTDGALSFHKVFADIFN